MCVILYNISTVAQCQRQSQVGRQMVQLSKVISCCSHGKLMRGCLTQQGQLYVNIVSCIYRTSAVQLSVRRSNSQKQYKPTYQQLEIQFKFPRCYSAVDVPISMPLLIYSNFLSLSQSDYWPDKKTSLSLLFKSIADVTGMLLKGHSPNECHIGNINFSFKTCSQMVQN